MRKNTDHGFNLSRMIAQIDFARTMNRKQWRTLEALSSLEFPITVSDWCDPDMMALFRNDLVELKSSSGSTTACWSATDAGSNLVILRTEEPLVW